MDLIKAKDILAAFANKDVANPSLEDLNAAKAAFAAAARTAKDSGKREELVAMLEAIKGTNLAIEAIEKAAEEEAAELAELTAEFPELNDAPAEPAAPAEAPAEAPAGQMLSIDQVAQNLGLAPETASTAVEVISEPRQTLTINGEDVPVNTPISELSAVFHRNTKASARTGRTTLATLRTEFATNLTGKRADDTRTLNELSRQAADPAIVAAGGLCTLAEPIRDIPVFATTGTPIADSLPAVGAPAGAVTFFPPMGLPQEGVFEWTIAQDEVVDADDPTTWKSCVEVDCDDPETVIVDAIYHCLTIGNFNRQFAPERWDAVLQLVAAQQARISERKLFRLIYGNANTKKKTVADLGSIYLTVLSGASRAWATISQNQRFDGRRARMIMPAWVRLAAELDMQARAIKRGRTLVEKTLEEALRDVGIDVTWSGDISPIDENPGAGVPQFPASFQATLNVDGGIFRLDGGELNLGTDIRDMDLNRQNKVGAFAETFGTVAVRSLDTWGLTFPVTVCDEAPCSVEAPGTTADEPLYTSAVTAG